VNTKWGKVRADMGHPAPFNLKFVGIGNEQWGKEYPERVQDENITVIAVLLDGPVKLYRGVGQVISSN
jgi:alpha-L-arabinofuranosidase